MTFEQLALVLIRTAQVYRIVRSESRLSQSRLHGDVRAYVEGLTYTGLWSQYESLKRFYQTFKPFQNHRTVDSISCLEARNISVN